MADRQERLAANVSQGPAVRPDPERARRHVLAQLRQMTWEATQWLSYDEVRAVLPKLAKIGYFKVQRPRDPNDVDWIVEITPR